GDKVLVPNPGYPTYSSVSNLVEAKIIYYDLLENSNWEPDFNELEKSDLSKAKLMWVNYPNMPTGASASKQLFNKLINFAKKHKILICNDNPYSFILNDKPLSILETPGAKEVAIELNSLSKSHNMAGWRLGMVAGKEEYIQTIIKVNSNVHSGIFKPIQEASVEALNNPPSWYQNLNFIYKERRKIVWDIFDLLDCQYDKTQNGMFVWAKIPVCKKSAKKYSDQILKQANVFITPGFIFGTNGINYLRIALCSDVKLLQEAKNRIERNIN
ncbi:MAG: aminotransferase class I/II-fold pyridoxal phosphate-dependent enzyme, partial [Bacteroidales bacterium]|nr:aminotransferase class I/II-fold pyridoxal phosphate-dependent enzyme [Bacteroidales bacterium]